MKKYILDIFKKPLTREEAIKFFSKPIRKMNLKERKLYLENERKYLKFFKILFKIDRNMIIKLTGFSQYDKEELFNKEKRKFKLQYNKFLKHNMRYNHIYTNNFKDLKLFVKLSYRDVFTYSGKYKILFTNQKIYITSLSDYCYMICFKEKYKRKIKMILKRSKLYLR